jgi:short-subunit dehydrogenase
MPVAMRWESALVTGASSGLGTAFARRLAADGTRRLVLVGRDAERLQALAQELASSNGATAEPVVCDLADAAQSGALAARVRESPPDLLVNNAGFGHYGDFERLSIQALAASIDVNVRALVELSHAYVGAMRPRGRGSLLQVASTVAFLPVPYEAVYAASKAFVLSFSEALAEELRGTGIRVRCICPGLVDTQFAARAGLTHQVAPRRGADPARVAATALATFDRGGVTHFDRAALQAAARAARLAPRRMVSRLAGQWMRRGLNDR